MTTERVPEERMTFLECCQQGHVAARQVLRRDSQAVGGWDGGGDVLHLPPHVLGASFVGSLY